MAATTLDDLISGWRAHAARWQEIADEARSNRNHAMSQRIEARSEVYENCADDLERWQADQPATEPAQPPPPAKTEINNTAATTERAWSPITRRPVTPFGFTTPVDL